MKKKTILGLTAAIVAAFTINNVRADVEGGNDGECAAPHSNTCMVVHLPWPLKDKVIPGVLTIIID
ncbi:hypothetical protein [Parapedobacter sp. 10938]|uniref:hypothetical protein n=1 Tax=Parapedobacter flavus TaxID=3110225 RepID=UPI002DBA971A|nr:hypothetical protein [Parapedobacter sp. 10938]MEC3878160.1 hypothetical protein [Parapedobacter sp. 10938]